MIFAGLKFNVWETLIAENPDLFKGLSEETVSFLNSSLYNTLKNQNKEIPITDDDLKTIAKLLRNVNLLLSSEQLIPDYSNPGLTQIIHFFSNLGWELYDFQQKIYGQRIIQNGSSLQLLRQQMESINDDIDKSKKDLDEYVNGVRNAAKVAKGLDTVLSLLIKVAKLAA